MKRTTTSLLFLLLFAIYIFAAPRTEQQAKMIAGQFVQKQLAQSIKSNEQLHLVTDQSVQLTRTTLLPAYYIYNIGVNNGFVIVGGDDVAKDVLAYSDNGSIDFEHLPPNAKYWLNFYKEEIDYALSHGYTAQRVEPMFMVQDDITEIAPLLKTHWNQDAPYNMFCPMDGTNLSVTGCVATAMAMIMKYHRYPKKGIGSHSYTTASLKQTLSANFGSTTYDWDKMLNDYKGENITSEQQQAVATLMFHCGVAVEMNYTSRESGAIQYEILNGLINYFGYNKNMYVEGRDYCNMKEWQELIKNELKAGRPVMYSGQGSNGGHSFILDGYNTENRYHFNWGWGGYADGYFELTSLAPGAGGIGSGSGNFNTDQHIIIGAQPQETGIFRSHFEIAETMKATKLDYGRADKIEVTCGGLWNFTPAFTGKLGPALWQNGEFVTFLTSPRQLNNMGVGRGYVPFQATGTIPVSVTDGTYQLYMTTQDTREATPIIVKAPTSTFSYYQVTIAGNSITLSAPVVGPQLVQTEPIIIHNETVYKGQDATFTLKIKNDGADFVDEVGIYIRKVGGVTPFQRISTPDVYVNAGETKTLEYTGRISVATGQYYVIGSYKTGGAWKQFNSNELGVQFEVRDAASSIENTEDGRALHIIQNGRRVIIKTSDSNSDIIVYPINGSKIEQITPENGEIGFDLPDRGLYIIKQKDQRTKVIY